MIPCSFLSYRNYTIPCRASNDFLDVSGVPFVPNSVFFLYQKTDILATGNDNYTTWTSISSSGDAIFGTRVVFGVSREIYRRYLSVEVFTVAGKVVGKGDKVKWILSKGGKESLRNCLFLDGGIGHQRNGWVTAFQDSSVPAGRLQSSWTESCLKGWNSLRTFLTSGGGYPHGLSDGMASTPVHLPGSLSEIEVFFNHAKNLVHLSRGREFGLECHL
ncbi:hypothetical protein CEXT_99121 [Caerostris extrusa]|uniref:Uncharacterized protein n=1 Tax=Caerostris extrusa TaxID=172846 RepID=A0AAV4P031_CAEEX|nr:hypothetical protein CEXT_99121 [Caerostris extrusa]